MKKRIFCLATTLTIIFLLFSNFAFAQTNSKTSILLPVRINGKWGYINEKGEVVIKPQFAVAGEFSEGFAKVRNEDVWFYYIDKNGNSITKGKVFRVAFDFSEDLAFVQESPVSKTGFINSNGDWSINPQFDTYTGAGTPLGSFKDGLAIVYLNGKIGFINKQGEFVITPIYNYAYSFSEDLAVINLMNKYGFIDKKGKLKIFPRFGYASSFSEGLAGFSYDRQKFGFIDKSGKVVIEPIYDWVSGFSEGLASVNIGMAWYGHQKSGGKYGFIDKTGKIVIEIKYVVVNPFSEGLAPVMINRKWGFIDKKGKMIIEPKFDWAEQFKNGISKVTIDEKIGYIKKDGSYLWEPSQ